MSRINVLVVFLLLTNVLFAQTTYTWVGGANGDYQNSANWAPARVTPATNDILGFDVTLPVTVSNVPTQTIGAVRILSGASSVTFTANAANLNLTLSATTPLIFSTAGSIYAGDLLRITLGNATSFTMTLGAFGIAPSTGGRVTINGALTLNGGVLDFDVVGSGGAIINGSITNISGTFNSNNVSAITWTNGSNYYHAVSGAVPNAIPVAFWSVGSNCNITGYSGGTNAPGGLTAASFYNLTWNCPSQSGVIDLNFGGLPVTINGALNIVNTNGGLPASGLRFAGARNTVTLGSYSQTGGYLVLQAGSGERTVIVKAGFTQTAGTLDFVNTGAGPDSATLNLQGSVTKAAPWTSTSTNAYAVSNVQFSGTALQTVTVTSGVTTCLGGRFNIINTNTDPSGVAVSGFLRVINRNSTAQAYCSNGGNFAGTGTIAYENYSGVGTVLIYNGSASQTASSVEFSLSNTPANVTVSATGVVNIPFDRSITGTLTMLSGSINVGAFTLSLTNTSLANQLAYTNGLIIGGTLSRTYPANGLPINALSNRSLYPFGSGANRRYINIYFSSPSPSGATGGNIAISHSAAVNPVTISPDLNDNGSALDKRSGSYWSFNTGTFDPGAATISITALGTNIGAVNNIASLRLTDAVTTNLGSLIATSGTVDAPVVGKSALSLANINGKSLYIGSDLQNPLAIVSFVWTGAVSTSWTNPANWTSVNGSGFPSAPTENATISNTVTGFWPVMLTGDNISVYQLAVTAPASLTMNGNSSLSVFDNFTFTGTASFQPTSTFTYAAPFTTQNILNLPYGTLGISGSGAKIFPATTTVTGDFLANAVPDFTTNSTNFTYDAGAVVQRVAATTYNNIIITGNRGGNTIRLGNGVSPNTIKVTGTFTATATNYSALNDKFNTFDFASTGSQTIPGFVYGFITNSGNGPRVWDNQGSADPTHVISCKSLLHNSYLLNTVTGSKVKFDRTGSNSSFGTFNYNDLEIAGNMGGSLLGGAPAATISIAGAFSISATNFKLGTNVFTMNFNGTGAQVIPGFKANIATNTPAWKYMNLTVTNSNRDITLSPTDTVYIQNSFSVPTVASFSSGGFITAGSTVDFLVGSELIPVLKPKTGLNNYNNIVLETGVRILAGDLTIGGNLNIKGVDSAAAQLNVGNGVSNRTLTVMGNITINGAAGPSPYLNSLLDFNTGNAATSLVKLYGNLTVANGGLISTIVDGSNKGTIQFLGGTHQYSNTSSLKNGFVNFLVGDGINPDTLTLNTNLDLIRSAVAPLSSSLTVSNKAVLNVGTKNIKVGTDDGNATNANSTFTLSAGATLVTSNIGGVAGSTDYALEGIATTGNDGTVQVAGMNRNYNVAANYVLNGATVNPFPVPATAPFTMNDLTIGANVSLNRAIDINGTLDLKSNTLTQVTNDLEFNGLTSTTGKLYADQASSITIKGPVATPVGDLRFVIPNGNVTGEFNLDKGINVPLNSDLIIQKGSRSGDYITGNAASVLEIRGNTLTINGNINAANPGSLGGSDSSNLTLGGTSTVKFDLGRQILKNFKLTTGATSTLGTNLDITGGLTPGNEGAVSVEGTAVLTTSDRLTIKSNDKGTARVAAGRSTGGYIVGNVTVERHTIEERAWRLMGTPTYGQTIRQAWQENGNNLINYFGTIITTNQPNPTANGFDNYYTPGISLLTYNSATDKWLGVPNTTTALTAAGGNKAYWLFIRGDRTVGPGVSNPPKIANIRSTGTLFQGDLPPVSVNAGEFAAVSNNYASAIDFTTLTKSNIDGTFWLWDPVRAGTNGLGAWVTFSSATGWMPTPNIPGSSYTSANTRIESGSGFLVHNASGSAGSLVFKESDKSSGSRLVSRPSGIKSILQTTLYTIKKGEAYGIDGNTVVFGNEFSNEVDSYDAFKFSNLSENLGMKRNGRSLMMEARQAVTETDTVFMNMSNFKKQAYRLELKAENFDAGVNAYLEDNYLHKVSAVNTLGKTDIDFEVNDDAESLAADRFRVVFKNTAIAAPVIAASEKSNGVAVDWDIASETNVAGYELEKSSNGQNFTKVFSANAVKGAGMPGTYNWLDSKPIVGDNYYRVKVNAKNGNTAYSNVANVNIVAVKTGFSVFPNPVSDGIIGLKMKNVSAGNYTIKVLSSDGKLMSREVIRHAGGSSSKNITSAAKLVSGTYQVEITGPDNKVDVIRILVF